MIGSRRRLLVVVLVVASLLGASIVAGQALPLPVVPPVTPPTILWDVVIIGVGAIVGWEFQDEFAEGFVWVGTVVADAWRDLVGGFRGDGVLRPLTVPEADAAFPLYNPAAVELEDYGNVPMSAMEAGVLGGLAAPNRWPRSSSEFNEFWVNLSATVAGKSWTAGVWADAWPDTEAFAGGPVAPGELVSGAPSALGLKGLARYVMTSGAVEGLPSFLQEYADLSESDGYYLTIADTEYADWYAGYDAMSSAEKFQASKRFDSSCVLTEGYTASQVKACLLRWEVPYGSYETRRFPWVQTGEVVAVPAPGPGTGRWRDHVLAAPFEGVVASRWALDSYYSGSLGWASVGLDVVEIAIFDGAPTGDVVDPRPFFGGAGQLWQATYEGDLQSVAYVMGASVYYPQIVEDGQVVTREWRGMHVTSDLREVYLWHSSLFHWARAWTLADATLPHYDYRVYIGGASAALPWDEAGADDFGTAVQTGTGAAVWWLVDPVAALQAAFVPSVGVAARAESLVDTLETRWPFSLASSLSFVGSVGSGPIAVDAIDLGRVEVQADNAWLNELGRLTRLVATGLLATLLFVWIRGKVMPKVVV